MRKVIMACMGILALSASTTFAADLRMPTKGPAFIPTYNWTGFYVGLNGGYGWGTSNWSNAVATTGDFNINGALIGGTLGYNMQFGSFVAGLEGDLDWSTIKGSSSAPVCLPGTCDTKNSWLATGRVRLGYAFDRWLPFVTGGVACGDVQASTPLGTDKKTTFGWTVGGGLEAALWSSWTWKVEYLYVVLGKGQCTAACGNPPSAVDVDFKANIIRAGLNYRF